MASAFPPPSASPAPPVRPERGVVMLTTGLSHGGAEHQLVQLAERLRGRGWAVGVVSMTPPVAFEERLAAADVPVVSLGMRRGVPDPRGLRRLARVLRQWRPDVLHSHMVHANLLGRLVRLLAPVPVLISTAHNAVEGGRWTEQAYRLTDRLADLTTNVSRAATERYVRVGAAPEGRIRTVPNGTDLERYQPDDEARARLRADLGVGDAFLWLAVGRLDVQKDVPNLLRALARTPAETGQLVIAGEGPLRAELEALAEGLGLGARVRFLGLRDDVPALMNAADGYVLSSLFEGLPLVLVEAAATGRLIVTTDAGGSAEIVGGGDGPNGRFVVPVENADALAAAMRHAAMLPAAERAAIGDWNRAHAHAEYDIDRVVETWDELYRALLAENLPR